MDVVTPAQAMLQASRQTLEELHHVCGPLLGRLWADPSIRLTRFGVLRSLTLRGDSGAGFLLAVAPAGQPGSHHHHAGAAQRAGPHTRKRVSLCVCTATA